MQIKFKYFHSCIGNYEGYLVNLNYEVGISSSYYFRSGNNSNIKV